MDGNSLAGSKRHREDGSEESEPAPSAPAPLDSETERVSKHLGTDPVPLESAMERVRKHLSNDAAGPKLEKAVAIAEKLLLSSLTSKTSGLFLEALISAAGPDEERLRDPRLRSALSPLLRTAETRIGDFHERDRLAVRALALSGVHLYDIANADDAFDFNKRFKALHEALGTLPSEEYPRSSLIQKAVVDTLELLLDLHERRGWAAPTIKAAFRVASEKRMLLSETLRGRLDRCSMLLHARQTAAMSTAARSYASGPRSGAGAGAMSGKAHPLLNVSGGGMVSSARGAAVAAVPGVRSMIEKQTQAEGRDKARLEGASGTSSGSGNDGKGQVSVLTESVPGGATSAVL